MSARLTRRRLLASGAASAALLSQGTGLGRALAAAAARPRVAGMNVLVFITDQERGIQHFPKGWARDNLPGLTRLQQHGLTFENACTSSCMCSPARATLMTGYFPAQHGVKYTLEENMHPPKNPQVQLSTRFRNVASVAAGSGYSAVYKGKWHLCKPAGEDYAPSDVGKYGFGRWNPPDAGANQYPDQAGGGYANNDGRYMDSVGDADAGQEGVLQYLGSEAACSQPFFLVVSLVNPHDGLAYPSSYTDFGYDDSWLEGSIDVPATIDEDLSTKPTAQQQFLKMFNQMNGKLTTRDMQRAYLNFYGNLMKASDAYLVEILDKLEETGLIDDTLVIKTSDHGEMGLAHGGLRQKNFNFYEESMRVPLVYSNPRLYPEPRRTGAMVSHVDFLPTLASLLRAPRNARGRWQGVDYSRLVLDPSSGPVQDYVVFTYDDYQSGQPTPPYPQPPNHVVGIRERRWKLAEYFDPKGEQGPQWEMYDLRKDPLERRNIAYRKHHRTPEQERQFLRLRRKLARVQRTRLRPLGR
ncbi:MAG TPA: sulfatase-like hydrolase/transferase [Thermoleophilaceae bacterium]